MEIRPSTSAENALDTVVLLEAIGLEELEAIAGEVKSRLGVGGVDAIESEAYRLAYLLGA